jgi:orotate phosphoribosyltransferase-like protein
MGYYKNLVLEILELSDAGLSVRAIADNLGLAVITVSNILCEYGRPDGEYNE